MDSWAQFTPVVVATAVLIPSAFQDIRSRRIPNLLSLGGFVVGCVANGVMTGWAGAGTAFAAGFLVLALMFPFFVVGWMGAGDVKLIGAVGAICGSISLALIALIAIVSIGALMSLVVLAWRKGLKDYLQRLFVAFSLTLMARRLHYLSSAESASSGELPYAVAIASGAIAVLLASAFGLV
ncbi:MAG: prepilin peptidase [Gammaproteobacteria bacterium]|nr:prepilin peptidase [Gammaproteobacteria bacterium]